MTESPAERAPQGSVAEPEVPQHTTDPDAGADSPLEGTTAYELAVEDGAPLAATGDDPGAGDLAPDFREPGA
ncbi:hypothetical protein [Cellulomonas sp. ATA003]|uniref:hypothetical protein n=1 Tax=Cellulomonas sp. ATA003 TaxID=3073064 RepID=UPI00287341A3|nr:hypothetical protein [Cellulomonas sp. ATA003]WNB85621.1 hypothetical protein REH70_19205 [Cellulomonas sp. ATA003]